MKKLACKKCGESRYVKSGTIRGHQRYLCQDCGCHFTETAVRGKPPAMKALAILLYAMGNITQSMIARLLGVSHADVYKWVGKKAEHTPARSVTSADEMLQVDEVWHCVNGEKIRFGSGEPSILWQGEPWRGSWVAVMMRPDNNFSEKFGSKATSS
ncbi:MAG: hypothetical protein ABI604_06210 [Nitrospirota bacterium]